MPNPQQKPDPDFIPADPDFIPASGGAPAQQSGGDDQTPAFLKGIDNLGTGIGEGFSSLMHPIKGIMAQGLSALAGGMTPYGAPMMAHTGDQQADQLNQDAQSNAREYEAEQGKYMAGHKMESIGSVLPGIAAGALMGGLRPIGGAMRSGAAGIGNIMLGATDEDAMYGANPGRALSANRIMSPTSGGMLRQLKPIIADTANENRGILADRQGDTLLNRKGAIDEGFGNAIGEGTDEDTGAATRPQVKGALKANKELTHVIDASSGNIMQNAVGDDVLRSPSISPLNAAKLKSNLQGRVNYDPEARNTVVNTGLKASAHNLKSQIEQAVPESVESGQRLHDAMAAKGLLKASPVDASKAGLLNAAGKLGGSLAYSGLDAAGAGLGNMSRYINAPQIIPFIRPQVNR